MHNRVGIRCFRSLDLSLITLELSKVLQSYTIFCIFNLKDTDDNSLLLSYTYSLTDLTQSGVESRLGNMGNSWWLLLFTSVGKAHELTWCQPAFGCQPAFKTSTWTLVDPLLCVFLLYFSSFFFFFPVKEKDGKICLNTEKDDFDQQTAC